MTATRRIDYSVYLVTGRDLLPPGKDYYESLDESLRDGHVTVVQLREKHADTIDFIELAKKSLAICDKYNVPMLINDNLGVVQALPERVGLHIGQEDMPIALARKVLGPGRLLGLSLHNVEQARTALKSVGMADYVGVGPVYGTKSKSGIEENDVIGPRGAREIIEALTDERETRTLPSVLIGGINQRTVLRSLFGATSAKNRPDGVAVISAIVSRRDAGVAAEELAHLVSSYKQAQSAYSDRPSAFSAGNISQDPTSLVKDVSQMLSFHRSSPSGPPLIQTLTSHVSSTLSANIALAFSASPIMSHQEAEADDLGRVTGAVVLNIGTISEEAKRGMRAVGAAANRGGKPVVLDPVGVGASAFRKRTVSEIMNHTQITLLKGNSAELSAIAGLTEVQSRGVDSGAGTLRDPEGLVRSLALRERCLVLMTGKIDYLSDGNNLIKAHNGHELLGRITGSGCALGVTVAAGMAAACAKSQGESGEGISDHLGSLMVRSSGSNLFKGALLGLLSMTIASEVAAERADVKGPGSFIPALIDELAAIRAEDILARARIEIA